MRRREHKGLASATQWSTVPLARCAQFTSVGCEDKSKARARVCDDGDLFDLQTELLLQVLSVYILVQSLSSKSAYSRCGGM